MKIQISGLSEGIHHYRFTVAPEDLELGDEFHAQVAVDVTLDKSATQIVLSSSIRTTAEFMCDRCISLFKEELTPSYRMFYTYEGAETEQIDPAELQPLMPGQAVIDIADDVRQMLLLAIPLKLLCSEGCRGLCPRCGKNLNEGPCTCTADEIDPRWEVLRRLSSST